MIRTGWAFTPGLVLLFAAAEFRSACCAQDTRPITIDSIFAGLSKRQASVETGRFELAFDITTPKGTLFVMHGTKMRTTKKATDPFPPVTVTNRLTERVTFSRGSMRYEYEGPRWTPELYDFVQQSYVSVFNDTESKSYFGNAYGEHRLGFIHKPEQGRIDAKNDYLEPVMRHFRPLHASMGRLSASNCSIRRQRGEIDNRQCVIMEQKSAAMTESFWLDIDRDFIILRIQRQIGSGIGLVQLDISYALDKIHGWVPSGWRGFWKSSGENGKTMTLQESFVAKVSHYEIGIPLDPEEFEFSFPTGTFVEDQRSGQAYILREGNEKRWIAQDERRHEVSYADLVNSESSRVGVPAGIKGLAIPIVFGLTILVFLVVALRYIARRNGAKKP
jgi:hypothetical protein